MHKLKIDGFNNLSKTLSINIYEVCYAKLAWEKYRCHIDEQFNAGPLSHFLWEIAEKIGARILNIARQNYEPHGASVAMMIAEERFPSVENASDSLFEKTQSVVAHLDKSHITIHTYPDSHPTTGVNTFRADIDISTCGTISPLNALEVIVQRFNSPFFFIDYRIRGFTRNRDGQKAYRDHQITSIQDFLPNFIRERYRSIDVNLYQENIFHTKLILKEFELANHVFDLDAEKLSDQEQRYLSDHLKTEIDEIFYGGNTDCDGE